MATSSKITSAEQAYEDSYAAPQDPPPDIVVYNELRSCADLYRLYSKGQLEIKPDFQRDVVWKSPDKTRFIDSLMKQLPIPSMCFGYDNSTAKWIVIDGLQRMSSIVEFLDPKSEWKLSKLPDIDPKIAGERVSALRDATSPLHVMYERVENLTLPVTVLRCDFSSGEHMEYLFKIFHRLNAGGIRLTNQEIRNCIYSGDFNSMLMTLDDTPNWIEAKKYITGRKDRFRSVELILRIFAFQDNLESYNGNLTTFLNTFMKCHRLDGAAQIKKYKRRFEQVAEIFVTKVAEHIEKIGFSQAEALLVAVAINSKSLLSSTPLAMKKKIGKFYKIELLQTAALSSDLSRTEHVQQRINEAIQALS
ncbi:hypothetical protein GCM10027046_02790 [Uliginosibacterium flavum]|uniref:DUF262 domain-containing protein n=1 Tax=Uliginosibacterium flavum TaxID=1396831 RepID=A0ABV2THV4_9RHOO